MKAIGRLIRRFVEKMEDSVGYRLPRVENETPEESLTHFCKMIQEGKLKAWVFILGTGVYSLDRDGSIMEKEDVAFLCPVELKAPELRFIGNRLVSKAEEMERLQDPGRLNL